MRKKARPSRSSNLMLRDANTTAVGTMRQSDSIGKCLKHAFFCDEALGTSTLTDAANGVIIDGAKSDISVADGEPNTRRLVSWPSVDGDSGTNACNITGSWVDPNGKDVLILACGKARDGGTTGAGGHISFYLGASGTNGQLKVQPYYSVFSSGGDAPNNVATLRAQDYITRTNGQDYVFAAAMRGDYLEHWADGSMTDSKSIRDTNSQTQAGWDAFNPDGKIYLGHSVSGGEINLCQSNNLTSIGSFACDYNYTGYSARANGDKEVPGLFIGTVGDAEIAQDYYFLLVYMFSEGMPNDIGLAMTTMKAQAITGQKVSYLPWATLK